MNFNNIISEIAARHELEEEALALMGEPVIRKDGLSVAFLKGQIAVLGMCLVYY